MYVPKKENLLLQVIKYAPSVLMLILVVLISSYISIGYTKDFEKDKKKLETQYLSLNKTRVKTDINVISRYIDKKMSNAELLLKKELRDKIMVTHNIALNIYENSKNHLSKKEIINQIKYALESIRFNNGQGYFSIHTIEGINILHPINKDFEGTSVLNRKDSLGNYPVQDAIKIAKTQGEGFLEWSYFKPNNKTREFKKFGIVKKFAPYNLIITTAIFQEDFIKTLKEEILKHLSTLEYSGGEYIFVVTKDMQLLYSKVDSLAYKQIESTFRPKLKAFIDSPKQSTFLEYFYQKQQTQYPKISYLLKINTLNWIIGTGFNLEKLNLQIQNKQQELKEKYHSLLRTLFISTALITILLLIVSITISKLLKKMFNSYKNQLIEHEASKFSQLMKELNDILDNVPMMFIYKDIQNNILRANNAFAKMHNLKMQELTGVAAKTLFPFEYEKFYEDDLEIIKSKKAKLYTIETYTFDGESKTIEASKIPIFNDQKEVTNIIIFSLDITEKLKQKKALKKTTKRLYEQEVQKVDNYLQTIVSLVDLIEKRDFYTAGHSRRVAKYAVAIAREMNFNPEDIKMLEQIGLLHDIGKIAIPDSILLKPGKLSAQEFDIIKSHAQTGYDVIVKIPMFKEFSKIILSHHERYDGSGYPNALKADEIPLLASVLSVADAFDAMTSTRIYNKIKTKNQALHELRNDSGKMFHPKVIEIALKVFKDIDIQTPSQASQLPNTAIEKERFSYFFKDALTNFSNENYLDLLLRQDLHQYKCLNLILIHKFSLYNEKYGWQAGNEFLVNIAKLIIKNYPTEDIFRFHGPNFILLNSVHVDVNLDIINKELGIYNIYCELHHFDMDNFTNIDTLEKNLNK